MTGLDATRDRLLEIAVIITDGKLNPVDEGVDYVIRTEQAVLDGMGEWCVEQHGKSGLTAACLSSPHTHQEVEKVVKEYIMRWIPEPGAGLLAGSSVHLDKAFLVRYMPSITDHLSYRILDVSSIKEICRRWYPSIRKKESDSREGEVAHRALDDIQGSIRELKFYRDHIFPPLEPVPYSTPAASTVSSAEEATI
ncbi:oligoribonuclease [Tremella mesenterica]|uniref:Oligoribonuclease n=1 Tax=Tremella mesenterica TaxID=5217 RepID=A0A4Q1BHL2_TREME|nr:oligoribonuclease [Tremella mesenterica]